MSWILTFKANLSPQVLLHRMFLSDIKFIPSTSVIVTCFVPFGELACSCWTGFLFSSSSGEAKLMFSA